MPNNKRRFYIISAIVVILIITTVALLFVLNEEEPTTHPAYLFSSEEIEKIESGDIILRHGYGTVSYLVEQMAGNHGVSHCGMLLKDKDSLSVIHAISSKYAAKDGVQTCPFREFSDDARPNSLVVLRPKIENIDTLITIAHRYVAENAPFDLNFSMETKDEIYCSELLYYIFKEGADIELYDAKNPDHSFGFFFDTALFDVMIDHRRLISQ